ncbi:MAG TPA: histidine phosphatase family protein [Anaerolineae bacterium]|nr:histidine phosphatase family protein [Anaerolineae bacterium]HNU03654.1 histidine phosphatase family protein [Anaerolineae bacterium]
MNRANPTTLLLLRHGETEWNLSGRWQGQAADTELTDLGRQQARLAANRLRSYPINVIYSSDLLRASETAQIIGQALGLTPIPESALRELDIGAWTGLTWAEIRERYPEQAAAMSAGQDVPRGGGESLGELQDRLAAAAQNIVSRHPGDTVLVVSHGAALRSLVAHVLGASLDQMHRIAILGNTALSVVQMRDGHLRLVSYNDTAHLDNGLFQAANAEGAGAVQPTREGKSE